MGSTFSQAFGIDDRTPPTHNHQLQSIQERPSINIDVSISSSYDSLVAGQTFAIAKNQPDPDSVFTLWKPTDSDGLVLINEDTDQAIYISGSAHLNLGSSKSKKRKGLWSCCGKTRRRIRLHLKKKGMTERPGADYDDEYGATEVINMVSNDDIIIIPSEVFPLELVTSLGMTASDVLKKPKKIRRTRVPIKPDKPMGLWGLIKTAIGKDITKFPLPVNFSEPLSMLQRLAEDYEYSSILDRASRMTDPLEQLAAVAAFVVSSYATTAIRTAKPFNPLLGETYEFDRTDDMGWRCIAEQVCHHPPIAALHCDSAMGWVHWQQFTMKSNFRGTYLEIHPLGVAHLRFKTSENHYTWTKVSTIIRNLYIGKIYIEQEGEMDIVNHTTNDWCHLKFSSGGMFTRDRSVTGRVYNKNNEAKWDIHGSWDKEVKAIKLDHKGKQTNEVKHFWTVDPLPPGAEERYGFSHFACSLNELEDRVAPTDSRLRPDQRMMENGQWDEANVEKQRLEDKQRQAMKQRVLEGNTRISTITNITTEHTHKNTAKAKGTGTGSVEDGVEPFYTPCWFARQRDPISGQYLYMYNGEYWSNKEKQDWKRCHSIYSK